MSGKYDKYKLSPLVRQDKTIIYKGDKYCIDFQLVVQNSNYFYERRFKFEGQDSIELETEGSNIQSDSICTFIKTIQNEEFSINDKNIFSLHQLSIKYDVPKLTEITREYIKEHDLDLIFETIKYKLSLFENQVKQEEECENNFSTEEEEEKIATDFFKYINRKELVCLPVSILYRIINKPQMKIENKNEQEQKEIIEFLFKCLKEHGRESSVLFSEINIKSNQMEIMKRLIEEYSTIFDFQMINPIFLIETTQEVIKEHTKSTQKIDELSNKLDEERKINNEMKNEINLLKNNEIKIQNLNEQLSKTNEELTKSKEQLSKENEELTKSNEQLSKENDKLIKSKEQLFQENEELTKSKEQLLKSNEELTKSKEQLFQENEELIELIEIINQSSVITNCESENKRCIIQLKDDITEIPSNSFKGCSILKEIIIPSSVTTICESSFEGCSSLTKIIIPSTVRAIESKSFKGCNKLEEINIDCRTEIHPNSFEECESLNRLIISASNAINEEMNGNESSIFYGSNINSTIFNNISNNEQETILILINNVKKNRIKAKEEKIENILNLFVYLKKEKQISKKAQNIPTESFIQLVKNEEQILIKSNMTEILKENQTLDKEEFLQQVNKLDCIFIEIKYPLFEFETIYNKLLKLKESNIPRLKIAIFITGIEETDQHFNDNEDISYVTLDKCITKIQGNLINGSFSGCKSLECILIPSSVTQIGDYAFSSCSSLTQITIPSSVTQIGNDAFDSCSSLTQITIQQDHKSRFEYFENKLLIYKSTIDGNYDTLVWAKKNIETANIPSFIKIIKDSAFSGCSSLAQITIPSSVTQIEDYAFSSCLSLTQITIPSSVTQIGNNAFHSCSSLTQITIQQDHKSRFEFYENIFLIYKSTIDGNYDTLVWAKKNIETANIPSFIKIIKDSAFAGCSSLAQITIPSSVTQIGGWAFNSCSSLTQITIPSSVTQIGSFAFISCESLTQITIPKSLNISCIGIGSEVRVIRI